MFLTIFNKIFFDIGEIGKEKGVSLHPHLTEIVSE